VEVFSFFLELFFIIFFSLFFIFFSLFSPKNSGGKTYF